MPSITMTIDQLCLSPFNARTNTEDRKPTEAFKRSLLERGQMMPILIHPLRGNAKRFGVFAGGRRYANFKALIEEGRLPADHPIDVVVRDLSEADLVELSLAENMVRRDLRPYEMYAAVVKAHRRGNSIAHIAETVGQSDIWVARAIRLGTLAKPVFDALEKDAITVDEATAYAAIADEELQAATFRELMPRPAPQRDAAAIRRHMKVGDGEALRLLRFVGEDAYLAAGGRIEPDLFDDREQGRALIRDEPILRGLVDQRLGAVREATRARFSRPDLQFRPEAPRTKYGGEDVTLEYHPKEDELPDRDVYATIAVPPPQGDAEVTPLVRFWWASTAAKHGGGKRSAPKAKPLAEVFGARRAPGRALDDRGSPGLAQAAKVAIREETGIGAAMVGMIQGIRRTILRAMLLDNVDDGDDAALDFLIWSQLRAKLRPMEIEALGVRRLPAAETDDDETQAEIGRSAAAANTAWRKALGRIEREAFVRHDDLGEAFRMYRCTDPWTKRTAASLVCGFTLDRPLNFADFHLPLHDVLAAEAMTPDRDLRSYWTPSPTFLDGIPLRDRLAIAEPFVERVTFGSWQRLKSADLTQRVIEVVTGTSTAVKASMADAAKRWVHPLLAFTPPETEGYDGDPGPANDVAPAELAEAAE